nr:MAG TPA: hypothetical protein [Caudoviricetes sp.]
MCDKTDFLVSFPYFFAGLSNMRVFCMEGSFYFIGGGGK